MRRGVIEVEHVGPQVILVVAAVVGREASNEKEYHIHITVTIGVIVIEVNSGVDGIDSGVEDSISIAGSAGVSARVIDCDRPHHVKHRVKDLGRVVIEVIPDATRHLHLATEEGVTRIVVGVDHVIIEFSGCGIAHREFLVIVIDENDESTELVIVKQSIGSHAAYDTVAGTHSALAALQQRLVGQSFGNTGEGNHVGCGALSQITRDAVTGHEASLFQLGIGIEARIVFHDGVAVMGGGIVEELISM